MHSSKEAKAHTKLTENLIRQRKKMMSQMVLGMLKLSLSSVDPQKPVSQDLLTERKEQELNAVLVFLNSFK